MRIPRIYIPSELNSHTEIELTDRARQHVIQVLRLKTGAALMVFNGNGHEYHAKLILAEKRRAIIKTTEQQTPHCESPLAIHLGLGISKGERMDYAIQKAVELGVKEITPLFTAHCVVQLDQKRTQKRLLHWQGVIQSACEQCGRTRLPQLNAPQSFSQWLEMDISHSTALILEPSASRQLQDHTNTPSCVHLLIGPEGGFNAEEIQAAEQSGYKSLRLGPRILRTETAVVAGLSALQTRWGDLN